MQVCCLLPILTLVGSPQVLRLLVPFLPVYPSVVTLLGCAQAEVSRNYCPFLASGPPSPCLRCCPAGVDVTPTLIRASRADVKEGNPDLQQVLMALLSELLVNYFGTQVFQAAVPF